jgi:hypothetical protein
MAAVTTLLPKGRLQGISFEGDPSVTWLWGRLCREADAESREGLRVGAHGCLVGDESRVTVYAL